MKVTNEDVEVFRLRAYSGYTIWYRHGHNGEYPSNERLAELHRRVNRKPGRMLARAVRGFIDFIT